MYIMYIYNILEHNSLNCPGKQLQGLLVKISPKSQSPILVMGPFAKPTSILLFVCTQIKIVCGPTEWLQKHSQSAHLQEVCNPLNTCRTIHPLSHPPPACSLQSVCGLIG
jgi:hypothetical protein